MKTWFWTILTITLAVLAAYVIHRFPGNVLVVVDQWRVQVSLAFAILALLLIFAASYFLIRVLVWLTQMPERYRGWRGQRQQKREQSMLEQGWTALLEGRYGVAEKTLTRLTEKTSDKARLVLANLSAARAAHEVSEYERQDRFIDSAQKAAAEIGGDGSLRTAVAAAAADLWLEQGRASEALRVLQGDQVEAMRHIHTMRLMLRIYQQTNDHAQVLSLARTLGRKKVLSAPQAEALIDSAAAALLRQAQDGVAEGELSAQWQALWKDLRSDERLLPSIALAAAEALQQAGQYQESSKVLEGAIKRAFLPELLEAYARAEPEQVGARLQKAEQWLEHRRHQGQDSEPAQADLLATLGALCLAAQMWGQAQRYLEQSLALRTDSRVHALLGSMFDRIGQSQRAAQHWRLATAVSAALPAMGQDGLLPAAEIDSDPVIAHGVGVDVDDDVVDLGDLEIEIKAKQQEQSKRSQQPGSEYDELFDSAPIPLDYPLPADVDSNAPADSESADKPKS
jgi:HemY protein